MKLPGALLLPLDGMLVHERVPSMKQLGVTTPPRWDASPSQVAQHEAIGSIRMDRILVHHREPSMNRLGVLLLPLDWILVHHKVPSIRD